MILLIVACLVQLQVVQTRTSRGSHRKDQIVDTDKGRVRGFNINLPHLGGSVNTFLGIPFARPPLRNLRFKLPQPIDRWGGILNATTLPPSCYQPSDDQWGEFNGSTMWNPPTPISEDCLYLNVWQPKKGKRLKKAAVLVWIYGGGFYSGTTTLSVYDGKILAIKHSVIVVSIAYRIGPFGFLTLGNKEAPGNAGMFDQLMALEWIQNNIRNFGGDPNNVTIFGESAGSVSASLHLLSPLSRNTFQRAILQSGTANMPWAVTSVKNGISRAMELAMQVNCDESENVATVAVCLRDISPEILIREMWVSRGIIQFPFVPVIDGIFLPNDPDHLLRDGQYKKCPVLLGSNLNEGAFFLIYEITDMVNLTHESMNSKQFHKTMQNMFHYYPKFPFETNTLVKQAVIHQYTNFLDPENIKANLLALENAVGDCYFTCNVNKFAEYYASENVWMYYYTHRHRGNYWPEWMGVLHGDEINLVFGDPFKLGSTDYTEDDRQLSERMMEYWANFAKTGNPNQRPGVPEKREVWPQYDPTLKRYLELSKKLLQGTRGEVNSVERGPRTKQCAFWLEYMPEFVKQTSSISKLQCAASSSSCGKPARLSWILLSATAILTTILFLV